MMRLFRKKTTSPKPSPAPEQLTSAGNMAGNLSAEALRPEAQALLKDVADKMTSQPAGLSNISASLPNAAEGIKVASQGMKDLLKELSKKLFPHRHRDDATAVDSTALLDHLREQLNNASVPSIDEITPTNPSIEDGLNATAREILARGETSLDGATVNDASSKMPASPVTGDTKAEYSSAEALANPFSLVNINRGATSAIPISPGADESMKDQKDNIQSKKGKKAQKNERKSVTYKKKLLQSKFSRRRFLRDYSGTNILTVILMFILLIGVSTGTIITNVSVLIPETRINRDAGKQSEAFRNEIARNEPKLSQILKRRAAIDLKVESALQNFVPSNEIRNDFTEFLQMLEDDPRVELSNRTIEAIPNDLPNVESIVVSFSVKTSFLLWLKHRNQMIRKFEDIDVIEESIIAPPGVPTVNVLVKMARPGRN